MHLAHSVARAIPQSMTPGSDLRGRVVLPSGLTALNEALGVTAMVQLEAGGESCLLEFPSATDVLEAVQRYRDLPGVADAQLNYVYTPDVVPDDVLYPNQYAHQRTEAEGGWDIETGDPAVVIAIIGTGVETTHPDLAPNLWQNPGEIPANGLDDDGNGFIDDHLGWDFVGLDNDPTPSHPHETQVAGIAAAVGNNDAGVTGVCWSCSLMPLRISYTSVQVADALHYARQNGADVVNMSFGNYDVGKYGPDTIVEDAVDAAYASGVVLVATAGNNAIDVMRYPAALENVIATASTGTQDQRAGFSNFGSWVSVAAPVACP